MNAFRKLFPVRTLAAGCALALVATSVAAPALSQTPGGSAPKLVVVEDKKDLGTVAKGEPMKHTFVLKNSGTADLLVSDVKPSCGCTVSEYDKVIKPGGEGKITLTVDTKNFQGATSKTALVLTNDPAMPQTTLYVMAFVKPYVDVLPYGFFRIQALTGETATSELILASDDPAFAPTKVEAPYKFLKTTLAEVSEKERIAGKGAKQYKLALTAPVDAPEGLLSGYVKLQTGVAKQPDLEISISGYIKPTVTITPNTINFGNFDPKGEAVRRNVMLINNNPQRDNFAVTKAETTVPGISATVVTVDKGRVRVDLSVDDKIKKGVFEGELKIQTNDAAKATVSIPLRGVIL
jgi:hypothetical protein